jgi:hypothetical protein
MAYFFIKTPSENHFCGSQNKVLFDGLFAEEKFTRLVTYSHLIRLKCYLHFLIFLKSELFFLPFQLRSTFTGDGRKKMKLGCTFAFLSLGFSINTWSQIPYSLQGNFFATLPEMVLTQTLGSRDIAVGDINGDGSDDIVAPNTGFVWGPFNSGSFRGHLGNEMGLPVHSFESGSAMPPAFNGYRAVTVGDFNEDGLGDVVLIGPSLELLLMPNTGQSKNRPGFTSSVLVDNLLPYFAPLGVVLPAPNVNYPVPYVPVFMADDFDGDGHKDILISFHMVNHWYAQFLNTGIQIYWGNGDGTFQPVQTIPTNFSVLDLEFVDWNGDGTRDTFLYLEQNIFYATTYTHYIQFYAVQGRNITQQGASQFMPFPGNGNFTGLAFLKPEGNLAHRIALSGHEFPNTYTMTPKLWVAEFDATGNWTQGPNEIVIPALTSLTRDADFQGIKSGDFNFDGFQDFIVSLETEYIQGQPAAPAEIYMIEGPIDPYGTPTAISSIQFPTIFSYPINLPLKSSPGALSLFTPNRSSPKTILKTDFNSDSAPDIIFSSGYFNTAPAGAALAINSAAIRIPNWNSLGAAGLARVDRLPQTGSPSPGNFQSRCGVTGGKPVLGNLGFKVTLQDAPHSGIAAVWGSYANVPTVYQHLNMAFANPDSISNISTLSASQNYGGRAEQNIPIPNNPSLVGVQAFFQWIIADPNSNDPWPIYCSDAIGVTVGN